MSAASVSPSVETSRPRKAAESMETSVGRSMPPGVISVTGTRARMGRNFGLITTEQDEFTRVVAGPGQAFLLGKQRVEEMGIPLQRRLTHERDEIGTIARLAEARRTAAHLAHDLRCAREPLAGRMVDRHRHVSEQGQWLLRRRRYR